jgi:hypothetical protein
MTARQIIEAEDPKDFLLQRSPQRSYEKLKALLVPRGWTADDAKFTLSFAKEHMMKPDKRYKSPWRLSTTCRQSCRQSRTVATRSPSGATAYLTNLRTLGAGVFLARKH